MPRQTEIGSFEASKGEEVVATGRKRGGGALQRMLQKLNKTKQNKNKQEVLCNVVFFLRG